VKSNKLISGAATFWFFSSKNTEIVRLRTFILWALLCEGIGWCWMWAWAISPWPTIILTVPVIWLLFCELPVYLIKRQAAKEMAEDKKKNDEFMKRWREINAEVDAEIAAEKAKARAKRKKKSGAARKGFLETP